MGGADKIALLGKCHPPFKNNKKNRNEKKLLRSKEQRN